MLQNKFSLMIAAVLAVVVAGCGGSGDGNSSNQVQYSSQVVFGDSLSDVGSYAVGLIATPFKGGRYTINTSLEDGSLAKTNWTELIATTLGLPAPCPAETGLEGSSFGVAIESHTPECTSYAQGGARITNPDGPGNVSLPALLGGSAALGQLTVPIKDQIQNHLAAHGGAFSGDEIVFLFAGGNDAIVNILTYAVTVGGQLQSGGLPAGLDQAAISGPAAINKMADAGTELADYINTEVLGKGAKYVVVLNAPDLSLTPFGVESETLIPIPGTQALLNTLVTTFNSQLQANLTSPDVLLIDLYTPSIDQITHPQNFAITNVTDPACANNALAGSALICSTTTNNVISGDISGYLFADKVHPTPFGNALIAQAVALQLGIKGWL